MRIDNQDIARMARQLRDEQNEELHVRPWGRHRHFHAPAWLVALPAAVFLGFVLGLWTQGHTQEDTPLTALTDTVYITVPAPQPRQDTIAQAASAASAPAPKPSVHRSKPLRRPHPTTGRPVSDDHIRYDLLVKN